MGEYTALIWFLPISLVVLLFFGNRYYRQWRTGRILKRPLPSAWKNTLPRALPIYSGLSSEEQEQLIKHMKLFLANKKFYGCNGLVIDDEIRLTVAAQACLLVLQQPLPAYPKLTSILVYPSAFVVKHQSALDDGTVNHDAAHLLGESWGNGRVILSWDDVSRGVADFNDGHNVALHEFAHQLDAETGSTNGAPVLRRNSYKAWGQIFSDHYNDLQSRIDRGKPTVLDHYGSTNPAEFFAVVTETFFENPNALSHKRPELFEELVKHYQVDPRTWHNNASRAEREIAH